MAELAADGLREPILAPGTDRRSQSDHEARGARNADRNSRRARETLIADIHAEPIRWAFDMPAKFRDRVDVGLLRRVRQVADRHVLDHALAVGMQSTSSAPGQKARRQEAGCRDPAWRPRRPPLAALGAGSLCFRQHGVTKRLSASIAIVLAASHRHARTKFAGDPRHQRDTLWSNGNPSAAQFIQTEPWP